MTKSEENMHTDVKAFMANTTSPKQNLLAGQD